MLRDIAVAGMAVLTVVFIYWCVWRVSSGHMPSDGPVAQCTIASHNHTRR